MILRPLLVLLLLAAPAAGEKVPSSLRAEDYHRIRELYRLSDRFGEKLWPGFDARKVPIAVNHDDAREILIGHPNPPPEFHPLTDHPLKGVSILTRDGCSRLGPGTGGWATDVFGTYAVYMSTIRPESTTENYLSIFVHECFHVHQRRFRKYPAGLRRATPRDDPVYGARIGLESRILHAAVREADDDRARALTRMFLAVRRARRAGLDAGVLLAEGNDEYNEGTAKYVQVRLVRLLAESGALEPEHPIPRYRGFADAAAQHDRFIGEILPKTRTPITFFHAQYNVGMAQCLMLDRFRPGWKDELRAEGSTLTATLARQFPLEDEESPALLAAAEKEFAYSELLKGQTRLVDRELATIRGFLEGEGKRYRIHHGGLTGDVRRRTRGRSYRVPASLLESRSRVVIYTGGLWFRQGGLELTTEKVPFIQHPGVLEWIDRDPAADGSDLKITFERRVGETYHGLKMVTDGFVLEIEGPARVTMGKDRVTIRPLKRR